jgi:hypothetical protein
MSLKLNIGHAFARKAICSSLILLISIGFSFGGAQADICRGGADCLICIQKPHHDLPAAPMSMGSPGCAPADQNGTCGFEDAQGIEKFYGVASAVRSFHPVRSGIFAGASDEDSRFRLSRGPIAAFFPADPVPKAPIYLRNHSLLC